jgi:hypothetical protein
MRLQNVDTIDAANAFVPTFIEDFNRRFAKPSQDPTNAHKPLLTTHNLDKIYAPNSDSRRDHNLLNNN